MMSASVQEPLVVGTRGSDLALWQADHIQSQLEVPSRIEIIKTEGDQVASLPLYKTEGKGFFTKEIEEALQDGKIDCAVHSLKDLPTSMPPGLELAAIPPRELPWDWLLIRPEAVDRSSFASNPLFPPLKRGAKVGSSSLRRIAQMNRFGLELDIGNIRGNVPTRVAKLREGEFDAIVLAGAGLKRLNLDLSGLCLYPFSFRSFLPSPGQGALGLQIREGDLRARQALRRLHCSRTEKAVNAERKLLSAFGGGCHLPLGAWHDGKSRFAFWLGGELAVNSHQGHYEEVSLSDTEDIPRLIEQSKNKPPQKGPVILITSFPKNCFPERNALGAGLSQMGFKVGYGTAIDLVPIEGWEDRARQSFEWITEKSASWILFTSAFGAELFFRGIGFESTPTRNRFFQSIPNLKVGVVGPETRLAVETFGVSVELESPSGNGRELSELLIQSSQDTPRVLIPRGQGGHPGILEGLKAAEGELEWKDLALFERKPVNLLDSLPSGWDFGMIDGLVLQSPSAVESLFVNSGFGRGQTASFQGKFFVPGSTTEKTLLEGLKAVGLSGSHEIYCAAHPGPHSLGNVISEIFRH